MVASAEPQAAKVQGDGGEQDLSMEEILQSIRRIIAEDDEDGKKPVTEDAKTKGPAKAAPSDDVPGSDVLELTEMLKDDGTVVSLKDVKAEPPAGDILSAIDTALAPPAEKPAAKEAPPAPKEAAPAAASVAKDDAILSSDAASAAAASFKKLKSAEPEAPPPVTTPAPSFRSGTTVEDMVTDMLRPMMKDWLDKNLPAIVERIVEREVKKLTR